MKRDVQAIAIDMDGTLLRTDGTVSERNLAALQAASASGIQVIIATGRRHCYAMKVLRPLGLHSSVLVVSSNGTVTRTIHARLLHRSVLPLEHALWLARHVRDYRDSLVFTFDRVGPDGEDTRGALILEELDALHSSIGAWMQANEPYIERVPSIEDVFTRQDADAPIQAMLCGNLARMRAAEQHLLQHEHVFSEGITPIERIHTAHVAVHRTEYPGRDLCIVDLLPARCSKGEALLQVCRDSSFDPHNTLAIGDNWNDLSLFQTAGHSVVMSNAPASLQELARRNGWTVGPSNDADGVAEAIESVVKCR